MSGASVVLALITAGANLVAGGLGAYRFYRVQEAGVFWPLLRVAQGVAVLFALYAGVLAAVSRLPDDGLFLLYALLPVAIAFVAEQLRVLSAQTVLDARGIESAQALGERPDAEQRSVVRQILRRELGVMTLSALVVVFLALRAAGTA